MLEKAEIKWRTERAGGREGNRQGMDRHAALAVRTGWRCLADKGKSSKYSLRHYLTRLVDQEALKL